MTKQTTSLDSLEGVVISPLACPIVEERLDERVVRMTAAWVLILVWFWLFWEKAWVIYFLLMDFTLRAGPWRTGSPLAGISRFLIHRMAGQSGKRMVNAGPKLFAVKLGLGFALVLSLFQWAGQGHHPVSVVLAGFFACAAFLEAGLGICIGCWLYINWQKIQYRWFNRFFRRSF